MKKGWNGQGKVREFENERGKSGKSQGILTGCPNVKVSPLHTLNSDSSFCQSAVSKVMENSLRSGSSQGKWGSKQARAFVDFGGFFNDFCLR